MPTPLVVECFDVLLPVLTRMLNLSLETQLVFPWQLETSRRSPNAKETKGWGDNFTTYDQPTTFRLFLN